MAHPADNFELGTGDSIRDFPCVVFSEDRVFVPVDDRRTAADLLLRFEKIGRVKDRGTLTANAGRVVASSVGLSAAASHPVLFEGKLRAVVGSPSLYVRLDRGRGALGGACLRQHFLDRRGVHL